MSENDTKTLATTKAIPSVPALGIHTDIKFEEYLSIPAMSQSTLKLALLSAEHLKAGIEGVLVKKTPALTLGTAIHSRLLEPKLFSERYLIGMPCQAKLKSGVRKGEECGASPKKVWDGTAWYCDKHAPKDAVDPEFFITQKELIDIECIYQKVCSHPVIKLIRSEGGVETCCIWKDGDIVMKSRVDKDVPNPVGYPPVVVDIKKVASQRGGNEKFGRAIEDFGYDVQAYSYLKGLEQTDGISRKWIWLVVEDSEPYSINVILADEETLAIGKFKYDHCIRIYRECLESGIWPGYEPDIHSGGHNDWVRRNYKGILS